jgi:integrase
MKRQVLTSRMVEDFAYEPGGKPFQVLWDVEAVGLGVRVLQSGNKSWVFRYYFKGTRLWSFGKVSRMTLLEARKFVRHARSDLDLGLDPREPFKGSKIVRDCFREWMLNKGVRRSTRKEYERTYSKYVNDTLGRLPIKDLSRAQAQQLFNELSGDAPVRANRVVTLMRGMWDYYLKLAFMPADRGNPWTPIVLNKEKPKQRILSPEELSRLGSVLDSKYDNGHEAIRFILSTGFRKGEVENLMFSDLFPEAEGEVTVFLRKTKTDPREVPLSDVASKIIEERWRRKAHYSSRFVFSNKLGNRINLQRVWSRIRKEADIEDVRLHDLRHTFASYAAGENQSLTMIGQLLGHKHAHTSQRYVHAYRDPVVRAANQTSAAIAQQLKK